MSKSEETAGPLNIPTLDKPQGFGQAPRVEAPPILKEPSAVPKSKRKGYGKIIFFIILFLVLLGAGMYFALGRKEKPISVQTEKVARHTITETVVANGKVYPVLQVHISAEVSGEIIELPVKEGQYVHKGDLLLKINPKTPLADLNEAKANYASSLSSVATATANLEKAETDFKRNKELYDHKLLAESDYVGFKVALDVARAQLDAAGHAVEVAKASVDSAQDSFDKTTITAPLDGTISVLNSELGERVLGTVQNIGTEIMTISDLSKMEARVDIGETDVVLVKPGQKAKLEVDSFKDQKFSGVVTDVASSSKDLDSSTSSSSSGSSSGQTATQFQVRIRLLEGDSFRPGMSVTATIETRTHTNTLAAPNASVTARAPKKAKSDKSVDVASDNAGDDKKKDDKNKVDVVFVAEGNQVKAVPVKIGIGDDNYWEITDGLKEGDEIVVGGFKAIGHDLDDGKRIIRAAAGASTNSK